MQVCKYDNIHDLYECKYEICKYANAQIHKYLYARKHDNIRIHANMNLQLEIVSAGIKVDEKRCALAYLHICIFGCAQIIHIHAGRQI